MPPRWADGARRLVQPRPFLTLLVVVQLGATVAFALTGPVRNGWAFFQGGDQIWLVSSSWLLAQFQLPPSLVGYGWPYALMPVAGPLGPDYVSTLPAIVLAQVLILSLNPPLVVAGGGGRVAGGCVWS
ncbi:MAG: hypothetical protein FJW96_15305, partial [Actinobacteria bacterium]|nr:hypothetical protein [Actinomycetota bacterium]